MRKRYLFLLMLLFPLATMFSSGKAHAADPDKALYDAAIAAITNGAYYISTDVNGEKYFITQEGGLTSDKEFAYLFPVSQVTGGALYDVGFLIDPGNNTHFSNTTLTDSKADLHYGSYRQDGGNNRNDWERQVLYMNEEGKVAIRSCNTAYGESSWADAGRAFWTWEIADPEDEFAMPTPAYTYDPAFIWTFEVPSPKESIFIVVKALYNDYEVQFYEDVANPDPENVNMGTEFGQLSDWDTWYKFKALLDTNYDLMARMEAEGYDYDSDPDAPTLDEVNAARAAVDSMWQVILNSEVPYKLPQDGYYRILTRMRYFTEDAESGERTYVNKGMLASFDINYPDQAMYGTLRRDRANYVWKLTQHGDSISMYNVGMENYVSIESSDRLKLTKDEAKVSHVVFDYAANDKVDIDDFTQADRDIFYIRLASAPRHNDKYVHQLGHSRGKDSQKDQELSFWSGTYNMGDIYESDGGTSEWYLEPVSEEDIEQLIKEFEPVKNHDVLVQQNQELRNTIANAIEEAKDPIKTDFITSVSQLSSPNSDEAEGTNIGNLIDNDGGTFWHTSWHSSNNDIKMAYEGVDYHFLAISGTEKMVGNCNLYFRQRNGADNDHPAEVAIFGAADPETDDADWTLMAKLTIPKVGNGDENNVSFTVTEGYPYLRLIVTKVKKNDGSDMEHRTYWHAAEIHLSTIEENPNSQFIILGEVSTNLVNTLEENKAIADEDITLADYEKLLNAYEAFKAAIVDPTELRNALNKYAKVTEGVVEGQEPGQWASTVVPKAYDALYAEAKAYNEAGRYTAEQIHKYAAMLKVMSKSVKECANGIKTGVWYHIMFPTEEMYDTYGFDKSGAGKSDLVVEQEYQWGNFVAAAQEITEEGEADGDGNPTTLKRLKTLSKEDISDATRLFFMNKEEIDDEDVSLFRFVPSGEKENYTGVFNEAMENSALALGLATSYVRGSALITDKAQLSSNASDEAEGKDLGALIDGKPSTFWHSDWHQRVLAPHYLQVAFKDPVSGSIQIDITRRNNDFGHIEHMFIQGSEDGESWTNIGYMAVPYEAAGESVTTPAINLNGSYNYLRFTLTRRAGLNIEMDPFAVITNKDQYQVDYTYFHAAEFQIYPVKLDKEISANAKALKETYDGLHKIVNIYRDPTAEEVSTATQAYKAFQAEFNAAEGKAVLPTGADKPAGSYALQNKATGLFINAKEGKTNDVFLKLTPTFFDYKALGYERSLIHGKNINGTDCTYLHSGNNNHRLCTWDTSTPGSNSGLVIREVAAVEPAEFSFNLSIKVGEIYDFCSPVAITNKGEGVAYTGIGKYTDEDGRNFLALKKIDVIEAGQPAFYILEDTTMYEVDADPELVPFAMPAEPEFKLEGDTINGFIACLVNHNLGVNDIFFDHCYASCAGKTGLYQPAPCVVVDLGIVREVEPNGEYDFAICLSGEDVVDGIKDVKTAVAKISQPGDVYSVDGKLLKSNATLNSLNSLGKGMYILNGVKVLVK